MSETSDAAEAEASAAAAAVVAGGIASVHAAPAAAVSRAEEQSFLGDFWTLLSDNAHSGAVGLAATAGDAATLGRVGESVGAPIFGSAGAGNALAAAGRYPGVSAINSILGPVGLVSNLMSASDALDGPRDAEHLGQFAASASGALGGGITTMGLMGSGLSSLGATGVAGAGLSGAATGAGGMLSGAAGALGPLGALAGSFAGGYQAGTLLSEHTTVGENSVDSLGWIDDLLTADGERSFLLRQSENIGTNWENGDYLSAVGNGLAIGGAGLAGAVGGLAGGAVDLAGDIGGGISDAASWVGDGASDLWDSIWD